MDRVRAVPVAAVLDRSRLARRSRPVAPRRRRRPVRSRAHRSHRRAARSSRRRAAASSRAQADPVVVAVEAAVAMEAPRRPRRRGSLLRSPSCRRCRSRAVAPPVPAANPKFAEWSEHYALGGQRESDPRNRGHSPGHCRYAMAAKKRRRQRRRCIPGYRTRARIQAVSTRTVAPVHQMKRQHAAGTDLLPLPLRRCASQFVSAQTEPVARLTRVAPRG